MGSPVRLIQSGGKRQTLYGYDEFGNDRYGNQGELQPFGYTGYQRDKTAGSYFAQAREYLPGTGRFAGEDINKGSIMKGQYYEENSMNGADGFMRGGMNATVIAMGMVTNPTAAFLGIGCQIATDITQEEYSSPIT